MSETSAPTTIGDNAEVAQTTPEAIADGAATTDATFYADLNEDNRAYIEKSGFTDMNNVVQSAREASKSLSDGSMRIPKADASQEAKDAFYANMGVPKTAAEYDLNMPDGLSEGFEYNQDFATSFKDMAKSNNLTPDQTNGLHGDYLKLADAAQAQAFAQQKQQFDDNVENSNKVLADAWGAIGSDAYKQGVDLAFKGIEGQGGKALMDEMKATGILGQNGEVLQPNLIMAFRNVGEKLHSEGKQVNGSHSITGNPYSKDGLNITQQMLLEKQDPQRAAQLKAAAGS